MAIGTDSPRGLNARRSPRSSSPPRSLSREGPLEIIRAYACTRAIFLSLREREENRSTGNGENAEMED